MSTSFHGGCAEASNKPRLDQSMVKQETRVIDVDGGGDVDVLTPKLTDRVKNMKMPQHFQGWHSGDELAIVD